MQVNLTNPISKIEVTNAQAIGTVTAGVVMPVQPKIAVFFNCTCFNFLFYVSSFSLFSYAFLSTKICFFANEKSLPEWLRSHKFVPSFLDWSLRLPSNWMDIETNKV
jgi:hypothetical protein